MTIDKRSRYFGLAPYSHAGRLTLPQRLVEPGDEREQFLLHRLVADETLDQLALRYYGRDDLWWRIADANPGRFPLDWRPGDVVCVPLSVGATPAEGRRT
jgi:hypothetical protein